MSDQVIVFVADEKFLPHVMSLAVNCRREGEFAGDFLLIHPDDLLPVVTLQEGAAPIDLRERGFATLPVSDRGFLQKFNLFHPFLKRWRQALYLDADCMVQGPLSQVWEQLDAANPWQPYTGPQGAVGWQNPETGVTMYDGTKERPCCDTPILGDREEMPCFQSWQVWDPDHQAHGLKIVRNPDTSLSPILTEGSIYHRIAQRFPHVVKDRMWNTSMMCWEPASIPDDTVDRLRDLQAEFGECNRPERGGTDQQMIDLLLHDRFRLMPRKLFVYWGLDCQPDERQNSRVASESRGWDGTEVPVVIHMARWYANWLVKAPNADAYFNDRLGVVNHEFYQRNLADFDAVFPIIT